MRSGQNDTSMVRCAAFSSFSTIAVTPGYTVLRSTRCWPSRSWSSRPSITLMHGCRVGVQVLVDRRADDDDDVLGVRSRPRLRWSTSSRSVGMSRSSASSASRSKNGILPARHAVDRERRRGRTASPPTRSRREPDPAEDRRVRNRRRLRRLVKKAMPATSPVAPTEPGCLATDGSKEPPPWEGLRASVGERAGTGSRAAARASGVRRYRRVSRRDAGSRLRNENGKNRGTTSRTL